MENSNPNQQPAENNNNNNAPIDYEPKGTSPWRILLTVALVIFAVVRLANTCSKSNKNQNAQQDPEFQQMMQETQSSYEQMSQQRISETQRASNQILYTPYDELKNLTAEQITAYKITKVKKDSLMRFDLSTQLKVGKDSYFQKNHDDSLKMAVKTPEDLSVFFYDFAGKGDLKFNFMELKRRQEIANLKSGEDIASSKTFSYTIKQNGKTFNGFVLAFYNEGYFSFMEFESDKIKKEALRMKALTYLAANLTTIK